MTQQKEERNRRTSEETQYQGLGAERRSRIGVT